MTSQVNVDTIAKKDGTSAVATEYVTQGSAKAWANLNGTGTIALRDSLNISSTTDHGTGDYSLGLGNSMGSADYMFAGGTYWRDGVSEQSTTRSSARVSTASTISISTRYITIGVLDADYAELSAFGDLA